MRKIFTILSALLIAASSYADCAWSGLWAFPSGKTIKQNSIFILTAYGGSQPIIHELNKKHNIYLKNGYEQIKLIVTETCVGQFALTQALLKPERELEAGIQYTMFIDGIPEGEQLKHYNDTTRQFEPVRYTVVKGTDTEKPVVSSIPKEIDKSYILYGCGPAMYVIFDLPVKDSSALLIKATVKNLKSGKETKYYISPKDGRIEIGHGMCSGAFAFDDSKNYEVKFSFMDASGNIADTSGEAIPFTKPTEDHWDDWKKKK